MRSLCSLVCKWNYEIGADGREIGWNEGFLHQILRDLGFMGPDLLNIWLPIQELQIYAKRRKAPASYLITNKLALGALATTFSIWFISAIIL